MGNTKTKHQLPALSPEEEFKQLIATANITAHTWTELEKNLRTHIDKDIRREWAKLEELSFSQMKSTDQLFPTAITADNKDKNRYTNILPLETTRVKLTQLEGVDGSDYINANFVNSESRSYICCQAPIKETIADFHRMLWETEAQIIVMLTKLCEAGRIKATEYLSPVGEVTQYGDFSIEVVSEEKQPDESYVVRKFTIARTGTEEKKTVTHFHYLAWPDGEVPDETQTLHDMILQVDKLEDQQTNRVPTVVHCSAGIGRTGTYVIINSIIDSLNAALKKEGAAPPTINMMSILHQLRGMRSGLVNSFEQYKYCYETIWNHIAQNNKGAKSRSNSSASASSAPAQINPISTSTTPSLASSTENVNASDEPQKTRDRKKSKGGKKEKKEKKTKKEKSEEHGGEDKTPVSRTSSNQSVSNNNSNSTSPGTSNANSSSDLKEHEHEDTSNAHAAHAHTDAHRKDD